MASQAVGSHYCVTFDDAIRSHDKALEDGGAPGILNESGIRSAIARPYCGHYHTIHEKAAALVHSIVLNHGFVDGNKRTAYYLVLWFVMESGYELVIEYEFDLAEIISNVACHEVALDELAEWFRKRLVKQRT